MPNSISYFENLPDEILFMIFQELDNITLLNSFFDLNQRLNQILSDPVFTSHFNLVTYPKFRSYQLPGSIGERFILQISRIHHHIKWLNLESSTFLRFLFLGRHSQLQGIGLFDLEKTKAAIIFHGKSSFG